MGINKVILLGNLGSDVNVRHLPDGRPVANVNVATTETWRDQDGNRHKHTEWHRLNFFGRQAEIASEYMHKGSKVFVEGQLRTRTWEDAKGNERQTTEVRVLNFEMLSSRRDGESPAPYPDAKPAESPKAAPAKEKRGGQGDPDAFNEMDEDIPW